MVKGGFDRKEWFQGCEQGFDKLFSYSREMKESFAYRNAIKNGTPEEMNQVIRQLIHAEKVAKHKEELQTTNAQKVQTAINPLPKIDETTRERIGGVSVFKMQDGKNYCVRAKIDGEQQLAAQVHPADIRAFFDGFKELSKEE